MKRRTKIIITVLTIAIIIPLIYAATAITSVTLTTPSTNNHSTENLTGALSGVTETNWTAYDWRYNGNSIAIAYFTFDINNSAGTNLSQSYTTNGGTMDQRSGARWNQSAGLNNSGAITFDGTDDVLRSPGTISINKDHTVSLWVKPSSGFNGSIYSVNSSTNSLYNLYIDYNNNIRYGIHTGTSITTMKAYANVADNTWHHIAVTMDNGVGRIYVDGTLRSEQGLYDLQWTPGMLRIGYAVDYSNWPDLMMYYYKGSIDDFMIFNRSLSAEQVYNLYANRSYVLASQQIEQGDRWSLCAWPINLTVNGTPTCSANFTPRASAMYTNDPVQIDTRESPMSLSSNTEVDNLNVDMLNGYNASDFLPSTCVANFTLSCTTSTSFTTIASCTNCRGYLAAVFLRDSTPDTVLVYANVSVDGYAFVDDTADDYTGAYGEKGLFFFRARFNNNLTVRIRTSNGAYQACAKVDWCTEV